MTNSKTVSLSENTMRLYGVAGYPVNHSLSPTMQNAAFRSLKLNACYIPIEIKPEGLPAFLRSLPASGISGLNLTIPHKEIAFGNVDWLSKEAELSGTVNTIMVCGKKLLGFSTDSYGLLDGIKEDLKIDLKGKIVLLLGAGGAAKAVVLALAGAGIKTLYIANRTLAKATKLAEETEDISGITCRAVPFLDEAVGCLISDVDLLINSTSAGLAKGDKSPVSASALRKELAVYDMIYNPSVTPLMKESKKAGAIAVNGLSMLLYQGAASFEIWTGKKAPIKVMKKALLESTKYEGRSMK